jgi:phospholipid/cholesterol/gamma-HCH transport system substrate-binding protein
MNQVNRFKLGLVIVASASLFLAIVIWLGASRYFEERRFLVTYLDESVQGLDRGSAVRYRGVTIGSVESIQVAPDGRLIEVAMSVNPEVSLDFEKVRATLTIAGLTGLMFINIDFPSSDSPSPKIDFAAPHPVVPSQPSAMKEIMLSLQSIVAQLDVKQIVENLEYTTRGTAILLEEKRIERIMGDLEKIVHNTERTSEGAAVLLETERIEAITRNVEEISGHLARTSARLDEFMASAQMEETLGNFHRIIGHVGSITEFAERQTSTDLIDQAMKQIFDTLRSVQGLSETMQKTVNEMNRTMTGLREDFHRIEYSFRRTSGNLDATLQSVKRLSDYLERDPGAILRGRTE